MKRIFLIISILGLIGWNTNAKAQAVQEGNFVIDVYHGWPNMITVLLKSAYSDEDGLSVGGLGPIGGKFEYKLSRVIGLGVDFWYVTNSLTYREWDIHPTTGNSVVYTYEVARKKLAIVPRVHFHFSQHPTLDAYGIVGIGGNTSSYTFKSNDPSYVDEDTGISDIPLSFRIGIGTRLYVSDNFGFMMEANLGGPLLNAGISLKL